MEDNPQEYLRAEEAKRKEMARLGCVGTESPELNPYEHMMDNFSGVDEVRKYFSTTGANIQPPGWLQEEHVKAFDHAYASIGEERMRQMQERFPTATELELEADLNLIKEAIGAGYKKEGGVLPVGPVRVTDFELLNINPSSYACIPDLNFFKQADGNVPILLNRPAIEKFKAAPNGFMEIVGSVAHECAHGRQLAILKNPTTDSQQEFRFRHRDHYARMLEAQRFYNFNFEKELGDKNYVYRNRLDEVDATRAGALAVLKLRDLLGQKGPFSQVTRYALTRLRNPPWGIIES